MPNPNPKKKFQKGKSGNPKGRPALSTEAKALQRLTREKLIQVISKYFYIEGGELMALRNKEDIPVIDLYIVRAILTGIKKGDVFSLDKLMDRAIGKVKDTERTGEATTINIINDTSNRPKRNSNKP